MQLNTCDCSTCITGVDVTDHILVHLQCFFPVIVLGVATNKDEDSSNHRVENVVQMGIARLLPDQTMDLYIVLDVDQTISSGNRFLHLVQRGCEGTTIFR